MRVVRESLSEEVMFELKEVRQQLCESGGRVVQAEGIAGAEPWGRSMPGTARRGERQGGQRG